MSEFDPRIPKPPSQISAVESIASEMGALGVLTWSLAQLQNGGGPTIPSLESQAGPTYPYVSCDAHVAAIDEKLGAWFNDKDAAWLCRAAVLAAATSAGGGGGPRSVGTKAAGRVLQFRRKGPVSKELPNPAEAAAEDHFRRELVGVIGRGGNHPELREILEHPEGSEIRTLFRMGKGAEEIVVITEAVEREAQSFKLSVFCEGSTKHHFFRRTVLLQPNETIEHAAKEIASLYVGPK